MAFISDDNDRWAGSIRPLVTQFRRDHPSDDRTDDEIVTSLAETLVDLGIMEIRDGFYVIVGSDDPS